MTPTILLADRDQPLLELLELRFRAEGWRVLIAKDAMTAISMIDFGRPDLVCMDIAMPGGSGFSVSEMMAGDDQLKDIPVIVLALETDSQTHDRCQEFKAHFLAKGPRLWERLRPLAVRLAERKAVDTVEPQTAKGTIRVDGTPGRGAIGQTKKHHGWADSLLSFFRRQHQNVRRTTLSARSSSVTKEHEREFKLGRPAKSQTPCLLLVQSNAQLSAMLKSRLESLGVAVIRAFDGMDGFRTAVRYPVNVIVMDYELPNVQGDYIVRRLKETPLTEDIPIVMLIGNRDKHLERRLLAAGVSRVLSKPLRIEQFRDELSRYIDVLERATNLEGLETLLADDISTPRPAKKPTEGRTVHA